MSDRVTDTNVKAALKTVIEGIASKVIDAMEANGGRVPYGMVTNEIIQTNKSFPNLNVNREQVNNALRRRKKRKQEMISSILHTPIVTTTNQSSASTSTSAPISSSINVARRGGRPVGTTNQKKRADMLNIRAAKNEICLLYKEELEAHKKKHKRERKNFPTGRLDEIINGVKKKRKIEDEKSITKKFIRKRITENRISVNTSCGPQTPLAAVEPKILNTILSMSEIREPLSQSRCINLVNDIIQDTPSQQKLSEFKAIQKTPTTNTKQGSVGVRYKTFETCMT